MSIEMNHAALESVSFGPYSLFPRARVLHKDGTPVALGSRALDILIALVERAGEVVNQRELISRAWRGLVVETTNLRVQMTYLRRCLADGEQGARYIANVPGQGYSFVAPVRRSTSQEPRHRPAQRCSTNRRIIQERRPRTCYGQMTGSV
ncbi:transcriptional regulator [Steroidobacter flavus]|uniref:Transcriptional regulator n=1 Tax=Steroidobacter flavus TaxID=1842136 RepID=A0ABV8T670_9GAMM